MPLADERLDLFEMELKKEMEAKGREMVGYRQIDGQFLIKVRMGNEKGNEIKETRGDLFLILMHKNGHEKFFGDDRIAVGDGTLETVFNCVMNEKQFLQFSDEIGESIRQIDRAKRG